MPAVSRERRAMAIALIACLGTAAIVAGCAGTASPAPPGSSAAAIGSAAASAPPSEQPPASASPVSTATAAPTATAAASPSATPSAFSCAYPFHRPPSSTAMAHVSDVAVGTHDGYDRVVFHFAGSAVPELELEQVSPPFTQDPSDRPLAVSGNVFVRLVLRNASGEGYASSDGMPTYSGPSAFSPGYPRLTSLVRAGDFEGTVTWIAGLADPACYHVSTLANPTRLVLDLRATP